jgi:hypothetical protein
MSMSSTVPSRGEVVAQRLRVEVVEVGAALMNVPRDFDILAPFDRQETVGVDRRRRAETGAVQHRRPEQAWK